MGCHVKRIFEAFIIFDFDGSIHLPIQDLPIRAWQEHTREVFSVDWSNLKKDTFASSSWDGTIKLVSRKLFSRGRCRILRSFSGTPIDRVLS
jgi:WD40 repeat protein